MPNAHFKNFEVAVYVVVHSTQGFADLKQLQKEYDRVSSELKFEKVYLEVYRDRRFAPEAALLNAKKFFAEKGVRVSGGVTLAAGDQNDQFGTFDYEKASDREECRKAVELAARHFDEVILDDFFFFTSKSDQDIAAKGARSWTQYRLDTMLQASTELVLKPAKAVNPGVRVVIKYPNWYEHFHGLGYDLERQPGLFDAIYTGTETRHPNLTDQFLQQYESYLIYRYFSRIRPGANLGGWVDTFCTGYAERYSEQLWDTLLAKAPEVTLFHWWPLAQGEAAEAGERAAWETMPTTLRWDEVRRGCPPGQAPGWGRLAQVSLEKIDPLLSRLGQPLGLASYRPPRGSGEDYLHNYLGNLGFPIDLHPSFPEAAGFVLLTESASQDPGLVARIQAHLKSGRDVCITSGLLSALKGRGIGDLVELQMTGRSAAIREFVDGFGAGSGQRLDDPAKPGKAVAFPEIRFFTNDAWAVVRGVAEGKGYPILLMNRYSKGVLYVLAVPDNPGDLYHLPQGLVTCLKKYLQARFPLIVDAPAHVSLFAYDNGTFVLQSFRDQAARVSIRLADPLANAVELESGRALERTVKRPGAEVPGLFPREKRPDEVSFAAMLQPHSLAAFAITPAPGKTGN